MTILEIAVLRVLLPLILLSLTGRAPFALAMEASQASSVSERMFEIDGRRNPELIPEWLAWREAFRTLAVVELERSAFTQNLVLTASEAQTLLKEARLEKSREDACIEKQKAIHKLWSNAKPEVLQEHINEEIIACRWTTLGARDRILETFGSKARASLEIFLGEIRASIQSFVPKNEVEIFWRPQ